MIVAHQWGTGGEEASHARLHTEKHVLQIRAPRRLQQLKAGPAYTMASLRPLNGAIQPGCSCAGGVDAAESYPAPIGTPRLDSGLRARHRSEPLGDCGN